MANQSGYVVTREYLSFKPTDLQLLVNRKTTLGLAPISKVYVGAAALGSSSSKVAYLGINVEFPGLPLNYSIHAEQFLITNLMINNERDLRYLAVSADSYIFDAPCGQCRQFLQELRDVLDDDIKIFLKNPIKKEEERYETLGNLFPRPFGPDRFDDPYEDDLPPLLGPRNNGLTLLDPDTAGDIFQESYGGCDEPCDHLSCMALAAANRSYAPYSKCPSGVALKDRDGNVYKGWYVESIAINPILGPVQVALVDFLIHTEHERKKFVEIVEAVLVEKQEAKVSQEKTTRMILETIASTDPKCDFKVMHCI